MRKLLAAFLSLLLFAGCANDKDPPSSPYIIDPYFEVYEVTKYGTAPQFQYFIFDKDHAVLDYGSTERLEPRIAKKESIVRLGIGRGTGWTDCRYYDVENKLISNWFYSPVAEYQTLVAYTDQPWRANKLIVRDMFDKTKLYRKFERDFADVSIPCMTPRF